MQVLVTGASGFAGGALIPRLIEERHDVRALVREEGRAVSAREHRVPIFVGDLSSGSGLEAALEGVEVAYYLVHSMESPLEGTTGEPFSERERRAAERFALAAAAAGVRRVVYLGGILPRAAPLSRHLASRLAVERTLLAAIPDSVALRASLVVGERSRSFRLLVRLVERLPVIALPPWRRLRTRPIDARDVTASLAAAATASGVGGRSLDIAGPDTVTFQEIVTQIADALLLRRPIVAVSFTSRMIGRLAASVAGEDPALVMPLMESLTEDLLPRDDSAANLLGVKTYSFPSAIAHALAEWEASEPLAAR